MVSDTMMLLCQRRLGPRCIWADRPIITKDICWSLNWDSKHTQLVAQGLNHLNRIFHSGELGSEGRSLHKILSLREPDSRCLVAKQQYTSLRPSSLSVARMIFASTKQCVDMLLPLGNGILKLRPVTLLETVLVDSRMGWVERQLPLGMCLQVTKYMKRWPNLGIAR
jgi:hypothetical protein